MLKTIPKLEKKCRIFFSFQYYKMAEHFWDRKGYKLHSTCKSNPGSRINNESQKPPFWTKTDLVEKQHPAKNV